MVGQPKAAEIEGIHRCLRAGSPKRIDLLLPGNIVQEIVIHGNKSRGNARLRFPTGFKGATGGAERIESRRQDKGKGGAPSIGQGQGDIAPASDTHGEGVIRFVAVIDLVRVLGSLLTLLIQFHIEIIDGEGPAVAKISERWLL